MRISLRTAVLAPTAAMAALLLLGACGGSSSGDSGGSGSDSSASDTGSTSDSMSMSDSPSASASDATSPTSGSSAPVTGELTKAGATLAIGKPAIVDWADSSDDAPGRIQVTVDKVNKGSIEDFKGSGSEDKLAGYTPYYVDVTFVAVADSTAKYPSPDSDVSGATSAGANAQTLITIGFDKCSSPDFPATWTAGTTVSGCRALVVPDGQTLTELSFPTGPSSSDGTVTWTV
jgi:hypothetical protein